MGRFHSVSHVLFCAALALAGPVAAQDAPDTPSSGTGGQLAAAAAAMGATQLAAVSFEADAPGIESYKSQIAKIVADASKDRHTVDLPPILKSVVVLDISVDREGRVARVALWRSNGYEDLEATAIESVKRIAVLPKPSEELLAGADTVRYLETFLFRPDGRFQIRSLEKPEMPVGGSAVARTR